MSTSSKKTLALCLLFLGASLLTSGCSIYGSSFEKGGGLTSDFLERIKEDPHGEDVLLPPQEQKEGR